MQQALRCLFTLLALSICWASAALAAPVGIARNDTGASTSTVLSLAVTAATSPGDLIVVVVGVGSSGLLNVQDSAGNSYTPGAVISQSPATNRIQIFYCASAAPLSTADTITVGSTVGVRLQASAITVPGMGSAPFDVQDVGAAGSSTAPQSAATASLAQVGELVIGAAVVSSGAGDTFVQPATFAELPPAGSSTAQVLRWGYRYADTTAPQVYGPASNSASRTWIATVAAFKPAIIAGTARRRLSIMGAGR